MHEPRRYELPTEQGVQKPTVPEIYIDGRSSSYIVRVLIFQLARARRNFVTPKRPLEELMRTKVEENTDMVRNFAKLSLVQLKVSGRSG